MERSAVVPRSRKMTDTDPPAHPSDLRADWPFPVAAALGSAVRIQGIEREIKAKLPFPDRKRLTVADGLIHLHVPSGQEERLAKAARIVEEVLSGIGELPVLPREVDDILSIVPRERLKWTKDGRLQSAGTRTVKLRGRGRTVTFHVFDPRHIEDVLDRGLPDLWREEDIEAAAEARRRAAGRAALTRAMKKAGHPAAGPDERSDGEAFDPDLRGWEAFGLTGLLR